MAYLNHEELCKRLILLKVNPQQYVFLALLSERKFETLHQILNNENIFPNKIVDPEDFDDLVKKGHILNFNQDNEYFLNNMATSQEVDKVIIGADNIFVFFEELKEVYPPFAQINGKKTPLTLVKNKNVSALEYYKGITGDVKKHKSIIEMVKKNQNHINFGLEKFISNEYWNTFEKLVEDLAKDTSRELDDLA